VSQSLFDHVIAPVASSEDTRATMRAVLPSAAGAGGTVVVVHVVEKAGGAPDKASVAQREDLAEEMFDVARDLAADAGVDLVTRIAYGTGVADTIVEVAHDQEATAIAFTPRGGSRWLRLLTGDVALSLVTDSDLPVVVLPDEPTSDD
jgi:nucleotide-binding universal stress UspA family protein